MEFLQTLVAISEVTKQVLRNDPDFFPIQPMDYNRLLVISLGTGSAKQERKYTAEMAAKWGLFGWLIQGNNTPILDVFNQASKDMVDYFLCVIFQSLHSEDNYLRIQVRPTNYIYNNSCNFSLFISNYISNSYSIYIYTNYSQRVA